MGRPQSRGHGVWAPAFAGATVERPCMTTAAAPSRQRLIRWRTLFDRVLVLVVIVALWQAGSLWFGAYWLSSPWSTATRFVEQVLNGELLRHAGYTLAEAGAGT